MKGWIRKTWMGCVVALALGAPSAYAEGGRITFTGRIVESTCGFASDAAPVVGVSRSGCGGQATALPTSFYRQTVMSLEDPSLLQDRLLAYLANYAGSDNTRLIVRAYD